MTSTRPAAKSQKESKLTKQDYTALVFVVDRSGSMWGIAEDMEGGISALLESQQELPGTLTVDFVRFDNVVETVYSFADPANVKIKVEPRGGTALYDAVGQTINRFGAELAALPEDERPENVIFSIVTDGYENASREFTGEKIQEMVKHQTDEYGWNFMYLGANQDAVFVAQTLGIAAGGALTYNTANVRGMTQTFDSYVTQTRSGLAAGFTEQDRLANK